MMEMVLIRRKRRPPLSDPLHNDHKGVKNGEPEDDERNNGAQRGSTLGDFEGKHDRRETEELAAGIPHEEHSGVRVEAEKPEYGPRKREAQEQHGSVSLQVCQISYTAETEEGDASREAVQTVCEIDGVGYADDRYERNGERKPIRKKNGDGQQCSQGLYPDPAVDDDNQRRNNLAGELHLVAKTLYVIDEAEQHNDGR